MEGIKDMTTVYKQFKDLAIRKIEERFNKPISKIADRDAIIMMLEEQLALQIIYEKRIQKEKGLNMNDFKTRLDFRGQSFVLAILDEIVELIEFVGRPKLIVPKKYLENNLRSKLRRKEKELNILFEMIDILHFILDALLVLKDKLENKTIEKIALDIIIRYDEIFRVTDVRVLTPAALLPSISFLLSRILRSLHWKPWKTYPNDYTTEDIEYMYNVFIDMFVLVVCVARVKYRKRFRDILMLYMIKRLENEDRQKRGY